MKQQLTAAVIGCGRMGAFANESTTRYSPPFWQPLSHAEAIRRHPSLTLAAMCDIDQATLTRAADKYQVEQRFDNPFELLDAVQPTLLGVATRTFGRAKLIEYAAATGTRAIHTEKPLCNSVAELQTLRSLFEQDNIFVTWGAIRRFFGIYQQARTLADSGRYGPLREIRVNLGPAPLFWTHPHSIDLLLFGAGTRRLSGVQARLAEVTTDGSPTRIDSDPRIITASLYFHDGVVGRITQALGHDFILSCSEAEIAVRANGNTLELYASEDGGYPSARPMVYESRQHYGGTLAPISQLVSCLHGEADSIAANAVVKRDILATQQTAFAALQSHLEDSRIIDPSSIDPAIVILARTEGRYA